MSSNLPITMAMSQYLAHLSALCDSGFALAIHIRLTRPTLLYRTYSSDWIDHYTENGFMLSDPVVHWGLSHTGHVNWDDLASQDTDGVLTAAVAHGLRNGLTYSTGTGPSRTISGLTRSSGKFTEQERAEIAEIVDAVHALLANFDTLSKAEQDGLRALC